MKTLLTTFILLYFFRPHLFAQTGQEMHDTSYVKTHKIKSVTHYKKEFNIQNGEYGDDTPPAKQDTGFVETLYQEFDRNGHITKSRSEEDDWRNSNGRFGYSRDSTKEIYDSVHRWIETKHFSDGIYQYSELYEYDDKGKMIRKKDKMPDGKTCLSITFKYDNRGNNIEAFYGDCYNNESGTNRWVKKYDSSNRLIYTQEFQYYTEPYSIDSILYANSKVKRKNGKQNVVEQFRFDYVNGTKTPTEKYIATYDIKGNITSEKNYQGKNLKLRRSTSYLYNDKELLIKQTHTQYDDDGRINGNARTIYQYNKNENIISQQEYGAIDENYLNELSLRTMYKWKYKYYP